MLRLEVISTWTPAIAADNFKMQSIWLAAVDALALLLFIRFIPLDLMLDAKETSHHACCLGLFHSTGQYRFPCESKSVLGVRKPSQIRFHEQDLVLRTICAPIDGRSSHGRGTLRVRVTLEDASDKDVAKQAAMRERPGTPFDVMDFGNMASEMDDDADDEFDLGEDSSKQGARQRSQREDRDNSALSKHSSEGATAVT
jgi:hypothetical protein